MNAHMGPPFDYEPVRPASPPKLALLRSVSAAAFAGRPVPPREWIVDGMVPAYTVTYLGGDGGVGKSLLALQLGAASVSNGYWCGREVKQGPCLFLTAEDDMDELHRRLFDVVQDIEDGFAALAALELISMVGEDTLLCVPDPKTGALRETELFKALMRRTEEQRPGLIILDTLANLFGGNENDRAQVRQFVSMLQRPCTMYGATVVLLAHPSRAGMATGSGDSGSTAWNNAVRSRLYLTRVKTEDDEEPDPTERVLRVMKANYGAVGEEFGLHWEKGVSRPRVGRDSLSLMAEASKAERVFMDLLAFYNRDKVRVSLHPGHGYAPTVFAADQRAQGLTKRAFMIAMQKLWSEGKIMNEDFGPPSRRVRHLVIAK